MTSPNESKHSQTGGTDRNSTDSRLARVPGVLDDLEREVVEEQFGVAEEQVRRDHAISHTLAAISAVSTEEIIFFGGTALSRTHLPDLRLSEDIDLIALADRSDVADQIERAVTRQLRRSLGAVYFSPRLRETKHPDPAVMDVGSSRVQVQLLSSIGYPEWPTEIVDIHQRYSDAPSARLRVLTPPAFAAAKLAAWSARASPRDLYDLWALAEHGMVDNEAVALFSRFGQYTRASAVDFSRVPPDEQWQVELGHQCVPQVMPDEAVAVVRDSWNRL